jgi:photosystem II stability/assembly factor-like uncharacterized protein
MKNWSNMLEHARTQTPPRPAIYASTILLLLFSLLLIGCQGGASATAASPSALQLTSASPVGLFTIHMLDRQHGWALNASAVLKTSDGGLHWHAVSPKNSPITALAAGDFLNANDAWISIAPDLQHGQKGVRVYSTLDGGKHWRLVTIDDQHAVGGGLPEFIDAEHGWLEIGTGVALGSESVDIYRTNDGGQSWTLVSCAGPQSNCTLGFEGHKSGLLFIDRLTGWATGDTATNRPWLYVTHDGGMSWSRQTVPTVPGVSNASYATLPPVFLGKDGVLPVKVISATINGLDLYTTSDGGKTWHPGPLSSFSMQNIFILDTQHAWAVSDSGIYATSNGGQSWSQVNNNVQHIGTVDFVDPSYGWAIASPDGQSTLLLYTTDGGRTWKP